MLHDFHSPAHMYFPATWWLLSTVQRHFTSYFQFHNHISDRHCIPACPTIGASACLSFMTQLLPYIALRPAQWQHDCMTSNHSTLLVMPYTTPHNSPFHGLLKSPLSGYVPLGSTYWPTTTGVSNCKCSPIPWKSAMENLPRSSESTCRETP